MILKNNIFVSKHKEIEIIPFADWHIGARTSNMSLIRRAIQYVKDKPNRYAIIVGDLIDMITYQSKGLIHTQKIMATEQVKMLADILKPIKNKILFAVTGNHEDRTVRNSGLDVMEVVCNNLEITYKSAECYFGIRFGSSNHTDMFYGYANHNSGGGQTKGAKHNRLINLHWRSPLADCIIGAHTHGHSIDKGEIPYMDRNGNVCQKTQYFVCAGTALGNEDYAAKIGCQPCSVGLRIIRITHIACKKGRKFKVNINELE